MKGMRPRFRALLALPVFVAAVIAGAAYISERRGSLYAYVDRWTSSSPHLTATDLSGGGFDMQAFRCGIERWAIKTLSDADAARALEGDPIPATLAELLEMPPPRWSRDATRFAEEVQYVIEGTILAYKLEPDGDVHLIIGADHRTMVVEFPEPTCVPREAVRPVIAAARAQLLGLLPTLPDSRVQETPEPIPVRIRGVLLFDKSHGQIGGTWNGVELHPVLEIERQ